MLAASVISVLYPCCQTIQMFEALIMIKKKLAQVVYLSRWQTEVVYHTNH